MQNKYLFFAKILGIFMVFLLAWLAIQGDWETLAQASAAAVFGIACGLAVAYISKSGMNL